MYFSSKDSNGKVGSQDKPRITVSLALEYEKKQGKKLTEVYQENTLRSEETSL